MSEQGGFVSPETMTGKINVLVLIVITDDFPDSFFQPGLKGFVIEIGYTLHPVTDVVKPDSPETDDHGVGFGKIVEGGFINIFLGIGFTNGIETSGQCSTIGYVVNVFHQG